MAIPASHGFDIDMEIIKKSNKLGKRLKTEFVVVESKGELYLINKLGGSQRLFTPWEVVLEFAKDKNGDSLIANTFSREIKIISKMSKLQ
jgi:hypothetical protein